MKNWLALAILISGSFAALAQGIPGLPLTPLGSCQLTPTSATKLSACAGAWNAGVGGIPPGANAVVIRVDTQAARYTDDGVVTPTSSVGNPILVADPPLYYQGTLPNLQFIQQTAGAKVDILFYKAP
jgi:hypothetical protein